MALKYFKDKNTHVLSKCQGDLIMTDEEMAQLGEECWYWSTIEDIALMFTLYGKDKVLTDVANHLIKKWEEQKTKDEEDI